MPNWIKSNFALTPRLIKALTQSKDLHITTTILVGGFALIPLFIAVAISNHFFVVFSLICGLLVFGVVFALN